MKGKQGYSLTLEPGVVTVASRLRSAGYLPRPKPSAFGYHRIYH
jgi:hypothetical protein